MTHATTAVIGPNELIVPLHPPLPAFLPSWFDIYSALHERLVRGNRRGDLMILNYTQKVIYDRRWDDPAVKHCRGLIVNTETGEVVALPFPKFFNFAERISEDRTPGLPEGVEPEYTEKLDGALGILYRHPDPASDEILWSTRGSFDSDQGYDANRIWKERYDSDRTRGLLNGLYYHLTLLVEIICPGTKQVVDYREDQLVIIGARDRFTGRDLPWDELQAVARILELPVVRRLEENEFTGHMARPGQEAEGVVARYEVDVCPLCDAWRIDCPLCRGIVNKVYRLKFKTADYFRLHRLKTKCTPRRITKAWMDGTLDAFLPHVPEEYRDDVERIKDELEFEEWGMRQTVHMGYTLQAPRNVDRKTFALWVNSHVIPKWRGYYFRLYDGKDFDMKREIGEAYLKTLPYEDWVKEDE